MSFEIYGKKDPALSVCCNAFFFYKVGLLNDMMSSMKVSAIAQLHYSIHLGWGGEGVGVLLGGGRWAGGGKGMGGLLFCNTHEYYSTLSADM